MLNNDIYDNLRDVPKDRIIAIWGLEKKSFDILTETIRCRINVNYFIDASGQYDGSKIFDKEVLTKEEAVTRDDIYIIIGSHNYNENKDYLEKYFSYSFYVMEIGGIERRIRENNRVFIYGAGGSGKRTLEILRARGVELSGFIDSDNKKWGKDHCDCLIYSKDILCEGDVVIISTVYYGEIYENLSSNFNKENIFVDYRNSRISSKLMDFEEQDSVAVRYKNFPVEYVSNARLFYTTLWNEIEDKKVILYGRNELTEQVINIFTLLGICIEYIVDDDVLEDSYMQYKLKDVYELAYENMAGKIVINTKIDDVASKENGKLLTVSGDKIEKLGIKWYSQYRIFLTLDEAWRATIPDLLLNNVLVYTKNDKQRLGLHVCNEDYKNKKIVILGGSTSTPYLYENVEKSWPEYLGDKYMDVTVYSLAQPGLESTRELLKLIRDVKQLEPDLIISYSGVNDMTVPKMKKRPFVRSYKWSGRWYGLENDITLSEFWIQMERYMKAICDVNGSEFIGILQPSLAQRRKEDLSQEEKRALLIWDEGNHLMRKYKDFTEGVKEHISKYDWMYDLTNVFDGVNEWVYKDNCHLNSRGNEIIADSIYHIINDYYKKKGKEL